MTRISKSWERDRSDVHSPAGVSDLRKAVKDGLMRKYLGIAETMFRYDGFDGEKFQDMLRMSRGTAPERFLMDQGECVFFPVGDQIHCLPVVMEGGLNMYGHMTAWRAVPVGWSETGYGNPGPWKEIYGKVRTHEDSVLMRDSLRSGSGKQYIESQVNMLLDNVMTLNQLQLLAKSPFVFNVSEDNLLSAKNFFLALCEDRPAIFTNALGEDPRPQTEKTGFEIDPALFELADRVECHILEYIGLPCVPITKRAQQSVSEVQSNADKIELRRQEKLRQREQAVDRINELWGTDISVVSVADEEPDYGSADMDFGPGVDGVGDDRDSDRGDVPPGRRR